MSTKITLRPLQIAPVTRDGEEFFDLHDRAGIAPDVQIPRELGPVLALCDGTRDFEAILREVQTHNPDVPREWLQELFDQLDELFLLDSPHFQAHEQELEKQFAQETTRPAAFAGRSYPANPAQLRQFLTQKLVAGNARLPRPSFKAAQVRGIVTPHIDFNRGGHVEAASYTPLIENVRATDQNFDTLVILGIAHQGVSYPFCATSKGFETPFGLAECDSAFLEDLRAEVGPQLLREQIAHQEEHSVEFSAVFCQFFEELRGAKIVPLLCGGFWQALQSAHAPETAEPQVGEFIAALQKVTRAHEVGGKKVGFIASVDGAHVGTQFGDAAPLTPPRLDEIRREDSAWIAALEAGDKASFHAHFAKNRNQFNVDAHPALYTLLAAFPNLRAQKMDYDQAFHPKENIVVSFASLALFEV